MVRTIASAVLALAGGFVAWLAVLWVLARLADWTMSDTLSTVALLISHLAFGPLIPFIVAIPLFIFIRRKWKVRAHL